MASTPDLQPGRYRHFKGGEYEVLGVACHSETDEALIVYQPLYGGSTTKRNEANDVYGAINQAGGR